jgi:transcriptional regulator with XRE-family HTH domain
MSYLTPEDHEKIKQLRADQNLSIREIARRMRRSEATVSNVLNGATPPRYRRPPPPRIPLREKLDDYPDFTSLPDHVLFQHVRECNFVG